MAISAATPKAAATVAGSGGGFSGSLIEQTPFRYLADNSDTDNEIPEMLARLALTRKAAECVVQHVEKRCLTDILLPHAIEKLAMEPAPDIEIVLTRHAPGQPEFCDIGAPATHGDT